MASNESSFFILSLEGRGFFLKSIFFRIIKLTLAAIFIGYLIHKGQLHPKDFIPLLHPLYLTSGLLLTGVCLLVQAWRWQLLLLARNLPLPLTEATRLFLIGTFFNYALPGSIGGDVVRGYYITQKFQKRKVDAILSVIIDRLLGLYSMVFLALLSLICHPYLVLSSPQLKTISIFTLALWVILSLFFATAFSKRLNSLIPVQSWLEYLPLKKKTTQAYLAMQAYSHNKITIIYSILLSLCAQILGIFFMILVGSAIGESSMPLGAYFFAVPLGFIISSVPIAPAGLGLGQVAFLLLFQIYSGQPSLIGQTGISAFQIVLLAWGLVGAIFYLKNPSTMILENQTSP